MKQFVQDHANTLGKGVTGILASGGAVGVSTLQQVEIWLRIGSLCVGILVGLFTIWSIIKKTRKE